ncbi:MAG: hypothetical protein FWG30_06420 [Eubacteriaceae bacterium]|nr:hypothetical protein [Eubacteriaceae bacterium]
MEKKQQATTAQAYRYSDLSHISPMPDYIHGIYKPAGKFTQESASRLEGSILKQCINLLSKTTNPKVFFERSEAAYACMATLLIAKSLRFETIVDAETIDGWIAGIDERQISFLNRSFSASKAKEADLKTAKAKANVWDKYFESLLEYEYLLSDKATAHLRSLKKKALPANAIIAPQNSSGMKAAPNEPPATKSEHGLYANAAQMLESNPSLCVGDIILLWWIEGKPVSAAHPQYFEQTYSINSIQRLDFLVSNWLVGESTYAGAVPYNKTEALRATLKTKDMSATGNKAELVERILLNFSESELAQTPIQTVYSLMGEGKDLLAKYKNIIWGHQNDDYERVRAFSFANQIDIDPLQYAINAYSSGIDKRSLFASAYWLMKAERYEDALKKAVMLFALEVSGTLEGPGHYSASAGSMPDSVFSIKECLANLSGNSADPNEIIKQAWTESRVLPGSSAIENYTDFNSLIWLAVEDSTESFDSLMLKLQSLPGKQQRSNPINNKAAFNSPIKKAASWVSAKWKSSTAKQRIAASAAAAILFFSALPKSDKASKTEDTATQAHIPEKAIVHTELEPMPASLASLVDLSDWERKSSGIYSVMLPKSSNLREDKTNETEALWNVPMFGINSFAVRIYENSKAIDYLEFCIDEYGAEYLENENGYAIVSYKDKDGLNWINAFTDKQGGVLAVFFAFETGDSAIAQAAVREAITSTAINSTDISRAFRAKEARLEQEEKAQAQQERERQAVQAAEQEERERLAAQAAEQEERQQLAAAQAQLNSEASASSSQATRSQPAPQQPDTSAQSSYTVYITNTGAKYHSGGCRYLSNSKIGILRNDAISQGYEPCSVCSP